MCSSDMFPASVCKQKQTILL